MSKPPTLNNQTHLKNHFIYFNLHKRCWSLKANQSLQATESGLFGASVKGRVTGHADTILATDVTTKISEAGRQRVIREKRKNVHAGIIGKYVLAGPSKKFVTTELTRTLSYNPYKRGDFYDRETDATVTTARHVLLRSGCDGNPPRVYYGDDLYYAYWTESDDGVDRIDHANTTGFLSKAELYRWIGWTHFTGFIRRVSHPLETYLTSCVGFVD